LFPLFAASVADTGGNLLPVLLTPVANLPLVSTMRAKLVAKFAASLIDTGGKFAADVVDTSGKFATGINNTSENGGKICCLYRWHQWQICHLCR
jgi:hypothetical protein